MTGDDDGDAMQEEDIIDLTDDADSMDLVEDVAMDAVERVCGLLSAVALGGSLGGSAGGSVGVGRAVHAYGGVRQGGPASRQVQGARDRRRGRLAQTLP